MQTATESPVNYLPVGDGKVVAVCHRCWNRSEPVPIDSVGEPDLLHAELSWSESPYPADYMHTNGSHGTIYTCPGCNERITKQG